MKFHLLDTHPASDGPHDPHDPVEIDRMWYSTLTNDRDVIERLLNPVSARDHLLRIRASPLLDHPRLYRVALKRAGQRESTNLLHDEFADDFTDYLALLPPVRHMIAEDVPAGYVLAQFYDAMCLRTECGRIIVISEVLRYFLYFMTLANLEMVGFEEIPPSVAGSALTIAARTMAMNEALDFDLDPRGTIPPRIDFIVNDLVDWQMRFIIGHEYAHHALGHVGP